MIRLAVINDLEVIMSIVKAVIEEMHLSGNDQWDENYPQPSDFKNDIDNRDLFVSEENGVINGFICVNFLEPEEYQTAKWSVNQKPMVIHRMAVNPSCRRQGIGSSLMKFAEDLALKKGVNYLRSDTYSVNSRMNTLFQKLDYRFTGEIRFPRKANYFNCYEKELA